MSLFRMVQGLCESLRDSLPATEDACAHWLAGFCWAFALHWLTLIVVTWLWSRS